ncbi:hypothetical protein CEK25_012172 [Fusarium fujikuroi]|nr:hypothetical protein CEK25_012172 [Fusarium fujikuroi]
MRYLHLGTEYTVVEKALLWRSGNLPKEVELALGASTNSGLAWNELLLDEADVFPRCPHRHAI